MVAIAVVVTVIGVITAQKRSCLEHIRDGLYSVLSVLVFVPVPCFFV